MPPPPSGPFRKCVLCSAKIPHQDGHDTCLICLGESHSPQDCRHCKAFTRAALKARQRRLQLHLWDAALSASKPSAMELPSASPSTSTGQELTSQSAPKATDAPAAKPPKRSSKAKKSSAAQAGSAPKSAKQLKTKASVKSLDAPSQAMPASLSLLSPILEASLRDKGSTSEATTPIPPRQAEPIRPLGAPSPTPSQLVRATTSLGSGHSSPISSGRPSPAHSVSPLPSHSPSIPRKNKEKRKHLSRDRHRSSHRGSVERHHRSRRRRHSSSDSSSTSSGRRKRRRHHRRRRSSTSSSSASTPRPHRRRRVKYIYVSSSASSASDSSPPRKRRRRRQRPLGPAAPQLPGPDRPPQPPLPSIPAPQPQPTPRLDVEPRRPKKHGISSSEDDSPFSSQDSVSEETPSERPKLDDLPLGETVGSDTGDPHESSPSEDFSSYSQMLARLAKALKLRMDEPPPPEEDLIFGDINKERSPPPSLSYLPALLSIIKDFWEHPSSSVPLPKRTENMYRINDEDAKFLLKHPIPNSLIVESSCSKPSGRAHVVPTNKEGRKLEMLGRRLYSLISFVLRVANYQTALGAYQKQLWLKIMPALKLLPDEVKQGYMNTYEEAQTVSKHQRIATRHSVEAAARILVSCVSLRRHAWLRSANILEDVKAKVEDLPFDASGLFHSKTDSHLEDVHKAKKTAKSYYIQPQPRFSKPYWKRSPNRYQHSPQFRTYKNQSQSRVTSAPTTSQTYRNQPSQRRQSYKPPAKKQKHFL
ncbi:uncharacterized protein LOC144587803 [Pogona vitticeps]